jgi:phage baseplate assembly protein W
MAKEFLGTGWAFPPRVEPSGKIAMSKEKQDIEEAIRIILGTSKGERVMRPDFGCGVHDLVFSSINQALINEVKTSVREALLRYEPRIEVMNLTVSDEDAGNGMLKVSIEYRIRATNNTFNLVHPFYLSEGSG